MHNKKYIMAIESSCDDTSCAILLDNKVLSNIIINQNDHKKYKGVVPELASRSHEKNIIKAVKNALSTSKVDLNEIKVIAYTKEPGLKGSLIVGKCFAKGLSKSLNIPCVGINHIHAHILCHFISDCNNKYPKFPYICLTISGGHTQLVIVKDYFNIEKIGYTIDDSVGEAFDKIGKILGLDYPSGPLIDILSKKGDPTKYKFPIPKVDIFNFSFSGFKTSVLYFINRELEKDQNFINSNIYDICASVQESIVNILIQKIKNVVKYSNINRIAISGGVSANSLLREKLLYYSRINKWDCFIPKLEYSSDNAAMIGLVCYFKMKLKYNT